MFRAYSFTLRFADAFPSAGGVFWVDDVETSVGEELRANSRGTDLYIVKAGSSGSGNSVPQLFPIPILPRRLPAPVVVSSLAGGEGGKGDQAALAIASSVDKGHRLREARRGNRRAA